MEPRASERVARAYVLVVGVKFDPVGEMTIDEAVRLAAGHPNAMLHLCHVVEEPAPPSTAGPSERLAALLDEHAEMLQVFALDKISTSTHPLAERIRLHVAVGDVAASLVRFACDTHADSIVVGAHSAAGGKGEVHGSVAARLAATSPCSVFVARTPDYRGLPVPGVAEADPFAYDADGEPAPSSRFRRHVRLRGIGDLEPVEDRTLSR